MMETGCIKSKKDIRNYKIAKAIGEELPDSFSLSHTTILDQGNVGSCVAHATSSILESIFNQLFSVGWIYGNRNYDYLGKGMPILDALKTARKYGCVPKENFDYNIEMTEIYNLVNKERSKLEPLAEPYKIGSYAELDCDDDIKQAIYQGLPVIASITCYGNLPTDENNVINITDEKSRGGHAIVIYGWNETGFLIQNSWGTDWGNNGTAILPYSYKIEEAWAVSMTPVEESDTIKKPNHYWLRELINAIIKAFRQLLERVIKNG